MNPDPVKISGAIITFNEEKNIKEVLQCFHFCDEIILVDSFSTDKTLEIAREFPLVKIVQQTFEDFTKQRNFALSQAKNDWVLFLDGDERITPKLESEILTELKNPSKDAYYFYRKFFFEGRPINYSGTQNDKNFRLFRKSKCHYKSEKKVHETLDVKGKIGIFQQPLLHYSVQDYVSYKEKMLHYGRLKGEELFTKGKDYYFLTQVLKTGFKFFKSYFLNLGFLDGKAGFDLCYLQSLSVYETYQSLRKLQRSS